MRTSVFAALVTVLAVSPTRAACRGDCGEVTINERIGSVANALNGCNAPGPTPTPTPASGGPLPTRI